MKILKISALEVPELVNTFPMTVHDLEMVRSRLEAAGFDMNRGVESYKGINNFYYLFIQEDQEPIKK